MNYINYLFFIIIFTLAASCNQELEQEAKQLQNFTAQAVEKKLLNSDAETRLYVFDCGSIEIKSFLSIFTGKLKDTLKSKTLANTCYLIKKGSIELIWDLGLPDTWHDKYPDGYSPWQQVFQSKYLVSRTLRDQLSEIGLVPEEIEYLAVSHMHNDHTGNLEMFPTADILIQAEEKAAAFSSKAKKHHFDPKSYDDIDPSRFKVIPGNFFDLFQDNSVIFIQAPGHTPGHQVLRVNLKASGSLLLAGDLYHFEENRKNQAVPVINHSKKETVKSMQWLEKYLQENPGLQLWIQHDMKEFEQHRLSPDYYK